MFTLNTSGIVGLRFGMTRREPKVFQLRSLPFGATASVAAFLRLSRALRFLGSLKAGLMWSSYPDDPVIVSRPDDVGSTEISVGLFFDSLGWGLSQDPEKDVGFSKQFSALGVTFDLSRCSEGLLMVGNTEKRGGCCQCNFGQGPARRQGV